MITCGWCHTNYAHWQTNCDNCGGPLPPPPGMDPGPKPPETPRKLPSGFAFRVKWSRNVMVIIGGIFFLVGALMLSATLAAKTWIALFPSFFCVGGFFMFLNGRKTAVGILHAFRHGTAVAGQITEVSVDTTQSINNRHPPPPPAAAASLFGCFMSLTTWSKTPFIRRCGRKGTASLSRRFF
jgi:hypothetical protein